MESASSTMSDEQSLEAARGGDEQAFGRLVEPYRGALHAHCYRMLGSVQDAEDALQEALLRAWRALPSFEGRSSLKNWLYRIATNTSLSAIERRPRRVLPIDYGPATDPHGDPGEPLVESVWIEPYPDESIGLDAELAGPEARYEQRESVELAFVAALQQLPPLQRAVLILRDVLGFSAAEVAESLDSTPEAVYSALQRAHATVDERLPEQSQQKTLRSLDDERIRELVESYMRAWDEGDAEAIREMLTEEATIAMPPRSTWYRGRDVVADFLARWPLSGRRRWRQLPIRASGQLAFAHYGWDEEAGAWLPHSVEVLTLEGDRIADITAFLTPEAVTRFDVPERLPR